jgi:hypothetical protein
MRKHTSARCLTIEEARQAMIGRSQRINADNDTYALMRVTATFRWSATDCDAVGVCLRKREGCGAC